jgi:hypothetical protein
MQQSRNEYSEAAEQLRRDSQASRQRSEYLRQKAHQLLHKTADLLQAEIQRQKRQSTTDQNKRHRKRLLPPQHCTEQNPALAGLSTT